MTCKMKPHRSRYGLAKSLTCLVVTTAARRAEIGGLSWSEIATGDLITIPEERSKNGREHEIPLSDLACEILERQPRRNSTDFIFGRLDSPFTGWSKAKADLDERLAATGAITAAWSLHDIRRTVATNKSPL
jgi:integrase